MLFDTEGGNPYQCTITTHVNSDGSEDVRIDQPVVDHSSWEYKPIIFLPGDEVTLTADGCVQTAGIGNTWKRYINPSGPNSGPPLGLYYGTIAIPGATTSSGPLFSGEPLAALGPLDDPNAAPQIFIPSFSSYPGHTVDLTLGYVDDNYTDHGGNGYWGHDNGDNDQCANTDPHAPLGQYGGPAWINLHIQHGQSNPFGNVPFDQWDVVPNGLDANGLMLNPGWGWQANGQPLASPTGGSYDPLCFYSSPSCTQQPTTYDLPPENLFRRVANAFGLCNSGAAGHRNWTDVTYDGHIYWVDRSSGLINDGDYSLRLKTTGPYRDPPGTTNGNAGDPGSNDIGLEFNGSETVDNFQHFAGIWHTYATTDDLSPLIDGHDAVVTGLMGIDEVHAHSEIHPVHALAIRESDPSNPNLSNDRWAFFVRNWGNEGECSSQQHYLDDQQVTLELPPPTPQAQQATLNADSTAYYHLGDGNYSFYSGPEGTFVTFDLPPGDAGGFWFGELDLKWDPPQATVSSMLSAATSASAQHLAGSRGVVRSPSRFHVPRTPEVRTSRHPGQRTGLGLRGSHRFGGLPTNPLASNDPLSDPPASNDALSDPASNDPSEEEPEQLVADIWNATTPAQQQTFQTLYNVLNPPQPPAVSGLGHLQLLASPPQRPATMPTVSEAPARAWVQQEEAQWRGICGATDGRVPLLPTTTCSELSFPPVTTLAITGGAPVVNGWYTTPVTATLTAADTTGSGIAFTQYSYDGQTWSNYTGPFTLPDGVYTFYYRSQDNQGDLEETRQQAFEIDTAAPNITINQPQVASYTHSSTLRLDYTVVDGNGQTTGVGAGSGVASINPTMDGNTTLAGHGLSSGQAINLLTEMTLGPHTFTVAATDNVGHADSQAVTFFIIVTPQSIIEDVNQFYGAADITQDEATSLLAKLQAAARQWAAGDCHAATPIYRAFIDELHAQSGSHVDPTAASIMIADANYLIGHCPLELRVSEARNSEPPVWDPRVGGELAVGQLALWHLTRG